MELEAVPDIRVVSVVADDDETWNARADYDESVNPMEAIGMLVVALAREVSTFVCDDDEEEDV